MGLSKTIKIWNIDWISHLYYSWRVKSEDAHKNDFFRFCIFKLNMFTSFLAGYYKKHYFIWLTRIKGYSYSLRKHGCHRGNLFKKIRTNMGHPPHLGVMIRLPHKASACPRFIQGCQNKEAQIYNTKDAFPVFVCKKRK